MLSKVALLVAKSSFQNLNLDCLVFMEAPFTICNKDQVKKIIAAFNTYSRFFAIFYLGDKRMSAVGA